MAITYEYVGKTGGGQKVHTIPIDYTAPSSSGTYDVVTVPIPSGVAATVCLFMTSSNATTATGPSSRPTVTFGSYVDVVYSTTSAPWGASVVSNGPITVKSSRNSPISSNDPSFKGFILWWENK